MFNRIDGNNPFAINKIEPAQKNNLKKQRNDDQAFSDEREKIGMQRTFLEILKENGVSCEAFSSKAEEGYSKKKKK